MSRSRKRRCPYCKALYFPEPRIKDRQRACKERECQRRRKQESQRRWVKRNPGYFRNRYPNTKEWLSAHPDYLKRYREIHPEYVRCNRETQRHRDRRRRKGCGRMLDIQDKILIQPLENIDKNPTFPLLDIQDKIRCQPIDIINFLAQLPCLDIQDKIASHHQQMLNIVP